MKPNRVTNDNKVPEPDKKEIIEPIVYQLTDSAVTYGVDWAGTIEIDGKIGWWRSNQRTRPHYDQWKNKFADQPQGRVYGNSYYFSHEEGKRACAHYRERVLAGHLRARQDSWTNSHAPATGVSFLKLKEQYPNLYKSPTALRREQHQNRENPRGYLELEMSEEEYLDMRAEGLPDIVPEETLASAVPVEEQFGMYQFEEVDEDNPDITRIVVGGYMNESRISEDVLTVRQDDGRDYKYYRIYIPKLETWEYFQLGTHIYNGVKFTVELDGDK